MALGFDRRGSGPALVLLHALGADRSAWGPVLDRLASAREVIAVDLPGFGESPPLAGEPTPRALAVAVAALLDEIGVERPHVGGNSLGGWVGLELALERRAASVTAIAPAGLWPRPLGAKPLIGRGIARAGAPLLRAALATEAGRRVALASVMAHPERVSRDEALRLVRAYAQSPGYVSVNAAMRSDVFAGLDRIRVPVTFGWPDRDRLVARPAHLPQRVRNVVLRDCGHVPMWDDPAQVAALLLTGSAEQAARVAG